ncbi:MAG: hypothetical protein AOA65_1346 [Candidatus Bathyarchaeota archaeon BA1]|nr:MAG: hypothetical protein AOA65_1346 [Candidatus Bathyarchaeota archaeon BA1]
MLPLTSLFSGPSLVRARDQESENTSKIKETKQTFPTEATINRYGFLYLSKDILAALGFQKGEEIKVRLQQTPEGLLVTKATSGS